MEILLWDGSAESLDRDSQEVENIVGILQDVGREGGAHDVFVRRCVVCTLRARSPAKQCFEMSLTFHATHVLATTYKGCLCGADLS